MAFGFIAAYTANMKRTIKMILISGFSCFCNVNCGESVSILLGTFLLPRGIRTAINLQTHLYLYGTWRCSVTECAWIPAVTQSTIACQTLDGPPGSVLDVGSRLRVPRCAMATGRWLAYHYQTASPGSLQAKEESRSKSASTRHLYDRLSASRISRPQANEQSLDVDQPST